MQTAKFNMSNFMEGKLQVKVLQHVQFHCRRRDRLRCSTLKRKFPNPKMSTTYPPESQVLTMSATMKIRMRICISKKIGCQTFTPRWLVLGPSPCWPCSSHSGCHEAWPSRSGCHSSEGQSQSESKGTWKKQAWQGRQARRSQREGLEHSGHDGLTFSLMLSKQTCFMVHLLWQLWQTDCCSLGLGLSDKKRPLTYTTTHHTGNTKL